MTRAKDISKILTDADISGTLDVTGETTLSNHLNIGDNEIIKIGNNADLTLYHDASNSYIDDSGTGSLIIRSNRIRLNKYTGENMIECHEDGAVELYHNAVKKIETTSNGVTVTGGVTTTTASTSTSAFSFATQLNNSSGGVAQPNDGIVALGFHNRADVNATGAGVAIAMSGGGVSAGSGNLIFCIKDTSGIGNVVAPSDEKMRIDASGNVFIGKTAESTTQDGFQFKQTGECIIGRGANDTVFVFQDTNGNNTVGNISITNSTTVYNTSSDYRLKESVTYDFDATTRLKQLKPCRFNFIIDADKTVDGFLAHEVSSIVPEAITGEKDAMTAEVLYVEDDVIPEGKKVGDVKEASKIDPQGIDQSKIVPLLTKTILELEARITALESA